MAVALLLRDMDHAANLGPVESAGCDNTGRTGELTNAEARQGAGNPQVLSVVDPGTRHATIIVARLPLGQIVTRRSALS